MRPVYYRSDAQRKREMCDLKKRFATRKQATDAATTLKARCYQCPYCKGYHLTTKKK